MIRTDFNKIVDDPEVFNFGGLNLAKVFHTYYYFDRRGSAPGPASVSQSPQRKLAHLGRRLTSWLKGLFVVTRLALGSRPRQRILFYGAGGRFARVGETLYDLYNARIVNARGRESFVLIEDTADQTAKVYSPDFYLSDFGFPIRVLGKLYQLLFHTRLRRLGARIRDRYPGLGFAAKDVSNIVSAFYANYLVDRFLLMLLRPSQALLICHYGREPFIAACKRQRIPVTELQHGTIAGHPFYIYPETYRKAFERLLLPDRIAVYGDYWRSLLISDNIFPKDAVVVAGYYLQTPPVARSTAPNGRTVALLTTQGVYYRRWDDYIRFLTAHLDRARWRIIIKPHPNEKIEDYRDLVVPGFVELSEQGTYELLAQCDIHISITSTVLFEAVRYGAANYVLFVPEAQERCAQIVATGVARPLEANQLPESDEMESVDPGLYFADFDPSVLFPEATGAKQDAPSQR